MKAQFQAVWPYAADALNLPVADVDTAVSFYEETLGFAVVSRSAEPVRRVLLARDAIQIGLAENGGDPTQEGAFIEVDDIAAAYEEIHGKPPAEGALRTDRHGAATFQVFFVVAPDGLCYCLGQRQA